ncbi:MAG: M28 family metallopeptidase, partial [Planctomycetota bacterium]
LATHYDSRRGSPGAGDAGLATTGILETVRFLVADPPLRTVMVLLTDGEESGLLGAKAWVRRHEPDLPSWAVLNFDARGNRGPLVMYEAAGFTKTLVDRVFDELPAPAGNSAAAFVYERMRNQTDFTVFVAADMQGLNFAVIDGFRHYHRDTDTTERITDATLVHYAETMRIAATRLANVDLPTIDVQASRVAKSSAYFTIGPFVLSYGMPRAILLVVATTVAFAAAILNTRPRRFGRCVLHIALSVVGVCAPALLMLWVDRGKAWHDWTGVAFALAVLLVGLSSWSARLPHRRDRAALLLLVALSMVVTAAALTLYDIRLSFLFAWPGLLTSVAMLSGRWWA